MKNPPQPGHAVRQEHIEPRSLTISDAAAALEVTRATLSELVNGKRGTSPEMAVRLRYELAQVPTDRLSLKRLAPVAL